jgi:hypothetical protein
MNYKQSLNYYSKRYFSILTRLNNNNNQNETNNPSQQKTAYTTKKVPELTSSPKVDSALDKGKEKLFEFMLIYEEAIGLKEIKEAQNNVLEVKRILIFSLSDFIFKKYSYSKKKGREEFCSSTARPS